MKYKAIAFDLDNTLYKYEIPHNKGLEAAANYMEKCKLLSCDRFYQLYQYSCNMVKETTIDQAASHNRLLYFQRMCENISINPLDYALKLYHVYWEKFVETMRLEPGVEELFGMLKELQIQIAVCTDLTAYIQYIKLLKLGVGDFVDVLVTSEEAGIEKPNERIFELLLNKLRLSSGDVLFVGDDYEKDVIGPGNVGMDAVLCNKSASIRIKNRINEIGELREYLSLGC